MQLLATHYMSLQDFQHWKVSKFEFKISELQVTFKTREFIYVNKQDENHYMIATHFNTTEWGRRVRLDFYKDTEV